MNPKDRKMAFYEVARGKLAMDTQKAFEEAQRVALKMMGEAEVTLKIKVIPPEDADDRFGSISYTVNTKVPARQSMKLTTELRDGFIVADGEAKVDVLQNELDLEFPKPLEMQEKKGG